MAQFFDSYYPYLDQINSGLYSQAVDGGLQLLREAKRFAPKEYEGTPKGTPFYLLGIAAFLSHDFQTATFLFDAAVSEDLKNQPTKQDTPALLFMQLNDKDQNQAALPIVKNVSSKIEAAIADYNGRGGSQHLTFSEVRQHFLSRVLAAGQPHLRTLTTTFISFFFEWDYRSRMIELSEAGSREPFFMHLFKGCLLFESLLKENPKKRPSELTLGPILKSELFTDLHIPASLTISSPSFETIVQSLQPGQPMDEAVACTGKTRNTLGHNLAWMAASLDESKYSLLLENIAASCLHAVSCLYK
jgi:hypothetical protein